jgi:hypothetical protein
MDRDYAVQFVMKDREKILFTKADALSKREKVDKKEFQHLKEKEMLRVIDMIEGDRLDDNEFEYLKKKERLRLEEEEEERRIEEEQEKADEEEEERKEKEKEQMANEAVPTAPLTFASLPASDETARTA